MDRAQAWCLRHGLRLNCCAAVGFLQGRALPLDEMVTHRFAIEQAPEAFEVFSEGKTGKAVFEWV